MPFRRRRTSTRTKKPPHQLLLGRRRRRCPFAKDNVKEIDYKDVELLQRYIGSDGKVIPSRVTGVSARMQRKLTIAIKRARHLALLPYTDHHCINGNIGS